mmetsp:Transcript_91558/g.263495  ORF Transcript_91558/g.263495 Transcript_91558/m.263495 type:complete len:367 (-) Transcript_91558:546-1646(-)
MHHAAEQLDDLRLRHFELGALQGLEGHFANSATGPRAEGPHVGTRRQPEDHLPRLAKGPHSLHQGLEHIGALREVEGHIAQLARGAIGQLRAHVHQLPQSLAAPNGDMLVIQLRDGLCDGLEELQLAARLQVPRVDIIFFRGQLPEGVGHRLRGLPVQQSLELGDGLGELLICSRPHQKPRIARGPRFGGVAPALRFGLLEESVLDDDFPTGQQLCFRRGSMLGTVGRVLAPVRVMFNPGRVAPAAAVGSVFRLVRGLARLPRLALLHAVVATFVALPVAVAPALGEEPVFRGAELRQQRIVKAIRHGGREALLQLLRGAPSLELLPREAARTSQHHRFLQRMQQPVVLLACRGEHAVHSVQGLAQ